jgi:hypothetical protein
MIMKKILLSVVCLVMVGIQSVQAQVAIAALHHNDSVKTKSDGRGDQWYDLKGSKLQQKPTQKGVYILNGAKVVIK